MPVFDNSLNSIDLSSVSDSTFSNPQISEKLIQLNFEKSRALELSRKCQIAISPFLPQNSGFLAISKSFLSQVEILSVVNLIITVPDCLEYGAHFQRAIDLSLSILELAKSDADRFVSSAKLDYDELAFAGLCNSNYFEYGSQNCEQFSTTFQTVVSEPVYGKPFILKNYETQIKNTLELSEFDLSAFSSYLIGVYGETGVVSYYSNLSEKSISSLNFARASQSQLFYSTKTKYDLAKSKIDYYQSQKINLINRGSLGSVSVSEKFASLKNLLNQVSTNLSISKSLANKTFEQNYLSSSISLLIDSDSKLDSIILDLDSIPSLASSAIEDLRSEALFEISLAQELKNSNSLNPDGQAYFNQAAVFLSLSETKTSPGEQFQSLLDAAKYARLAKTQTVSSSVNSTLIESRLSSLLERAQSDGLDVSTELGLLNLYKSTKDPSLVQLIESLLFEKVEVSLVNPLLKKRERLVSLIPKLGEFAADFESDLNNVDSDYFYPDGSIKIELALGKFSILNREYLDIEKAILSFSKEILSNSLSKNVFVTFDEISISSPTTASINLDFSNDLDIESKNITIPVSLDYPVFFEKSDFILGKDRLLKTSLSSNSLLLTFYSISQFDSFSLSASKHVSPVRLVSNSTISTGFSDGSALSVSDFEIDVLSSIPRLDFPQNNHAFSKGSHKVIYSQTIFDAFDYSLSQISVFPIGQRSKLEFDVKVHPKIDLNSASMNIPLNNISSNSRISITSFGEGSVVSSSSVSDSVLISLKNLKSSKNLTLRFSVDIDNSQNYSAGLLKSLELLANSSASPEISSLVSRSKEEFSDGNFTGSIELSQKAKIQIEKERISSLENQKKLASVKSDVESEFLSIEHALESFGSNSSFSQKLFLRKTDLSLFLNSSNYSKYDPKWLSSQISIQSKLYFDEYAKLLKKSKLYNDSNVENLISSLNLELLKLETSRDLASTLIVDDSISQLSNLIGVLENDAALGKSSNSKLYDSIKIDSDSILPLYKSQKSLAKGTPYQSIFSVDEKDFSSDLLELKKSISADFRIFEYRANSLNNSLSKMKEELNLLKTTAISKLPLISKSSDLKSIEDLISASNYVGSLKKIDSLLVSSSFKSESFFSPYLLMGSVALVAIVLIYLILTKYKKPDTPKPPTSLEKLSESEESTGV